MGGILECDRMLDHNRCLATLFEFSIPIPWTQEAESHLDVLSSLDILLSEDKCPIQAFMTAYVEIDFPNQVMVKSLKLELQYFVLPYSRSPTIREYTLWRNSLNTPINESCLL